MVGQLVDGAALVLVVLLFLQYGTAFADLICRTIDPAPPIIEDDVP